MSEPSAKSVFTFGYAGASLGAFLSVVEQIDATLLDCRFSPRSRRPEWSGRNLAALLGDRYVWVQPWGNPGYKGTEAALADADGGLAIFDAVARPSVIVMCVCRDTEHCHRRLVRDLLVAERGVTVRELDDVLAAGEARETQMALFREGR